MAAAPPLREEPAAALLSFGVRLPHPCETLGSGDGQLGMVWGLMLSVVGIVLLAAARTKSKPSPA